MAKASHSELKSLVSYFYYKHKELREYALTPRWDRDISIMRDIRKNGGGEGFSPRLIRELIDTFLNYSKRTKTTMTDFCASVDTLYGYVKDKAEGKRE
jgi:hypothetical protein